MKAVILDLDGVVTASASVHFRAWKETFDELLQARGAAEFTEEDYRRYVDGKPRYDGVRSFLSSRGIDLPEGEPSDPPDRQTVHGVGNAKNARFRAFLEEGVTVFDDALEALHAWRDQGLGLAIVSSSKNAETILASAGLTGWFDVRIDGIVGPQLGLAGKPAPDYFLEAARRLGVAPQDAMLVEDADSGIEAGRRGGFGCVVRVNRDGRAEVDGADRAVRRLTELLDEGSRDPEVLPRLFDLDALPDALEGPVVVFLDYDGTLCPIVEDPDQALLAPEMRESIRRLAAVRPVAVVSGRDRADVKRRVGLDRLFYAGSHGFDMSGPGFEKRHPEAERAVGAIDRAEETLRGQLASYEGVGFERKRFSLAVHYRRVSSHAREEVRSRVDEYARHEPALRVVPGKMVADLQPDVPWDKGRAVQMLLEVLPGVAPDAVPLYVGDDITDEDAFRALKSHGVGVLVGTHGEPTHAQYRLRDVAEVRQLLDRLAEAG